LEQTIERQWEEERDYTGTAVREVVEAAVAAHSPQMGSYLAWMAPRLIEMHRVLKPDGSIWLHCDPFANGYLRMLLDAVFGSRLMRNEIAWCYTGPGSPRMKQFNRKHDTIYWYSRGHEWTFNADAVRLEHHDKTLANYKPGLQGSGHADTPLRMGKVPESWWLEQKGNGLAIAARQKKQYVGYPTQKPIALLERIIIAATNPGDVVLDPFCGCVTACIAAQKHERQWIGVDIEPLAVKLCRRRLRDELGLFDETQELTDPPTLTEERQLELIPRNQRLRLELWQRMQAEAETETPACSGCGRAPGMDYMEVDHIIPRSRGGEHTWDNVQLLCGPCNRSKGNKTMAQWRRDRSLTGSR